jgi:surface antigen
MRMGWAAAAALAMLALAGCQSGARTDTAMLVGSIKTAGALANGLAGNQIGRDLDAADRRTALAAEYRALEFGRTGASTPWSDGRTGRYGTVVPGTAYKLNDTTCREYTHTIHSGGREESAQGTACRSADGAWQMVG